MDQVRDDMETYNRELQEVFEDEIVAHRRVERDVEIVSNDLDNMFALEEYLQRDSDLRQQILKNRMLQEDMLRHGHGKPLLDAVSKREYRTRLLEEKVFEDIMQARQSEKEMALRLAQARSAAMISTAENNTLRRLLREREMKNNDLWQVRTRIDAREGNVNGLSKPSKAEEIHSRELSGRQHTSKHFADENSFQTEVSTPVGYPRQESDDDTSISDFMFRAEGEDDSKVEISRAAAPSQVHSVGIGAPTYYHNHKEDTTALPVLKHADCQTDPIESEEPRQASTHVQEIDVGVGSDLEDHQDDKDEVRSETGVEDQGKDADCQTDPIESEEPRQASTHVQEIDVGVGSDLEDHQDEKDEVRSETGVEDQGKDTDCQTWTHVQEMGVGVGSDLEDHQDEEVVTTAKATPDDEESSSNNTSDILSEDISNLDERNIANSLGGSRKSTLQPLKYLFDDTSYSEFCIGTATPKTARKSKTSKQREYSDTRAHGTHSSKTLLDSSPRKRKLSSSASSLIEDGRSRQILKEDNDTQSHYLDQIFRGIDQSRPANQSDSNDSNEELPGHAKEDDTPDPSKIQEAGKDCMHSEQDNRENDRIFEFKGGVEVENQNSAPSSQNEKDASCTNSEGIKKPPEEIQPSLPEKKPSYTEVSGKSNGYQEEKVETEKPENDDDNKNTESKDKRLSFQGAVYSKLMARRERRLSMSPMSPSAPVSLEKLSRQDDCSNVASTAKRELQFDEAANSLDDDSAVHADKSECLTKEESKSEGSVLDLGKPRDVLEVKDGDTIAKAEGGSSLEPEKVEAKSEQEAKSKTEKAQFVQQQAPEVPHDEGQNEEEASHADGLRKVQTEGGEAKPKDKAKAKDEAKANRMREKRRRQRQRRRQKRRGSTSDVRESNSSPNSVVQGKPPARVDRADDASAATNETPKHEAGATDPEAIEKGKPVQKGIPSTDDPNSDTHAKGTSAEEKVEAQTFEESKPVNDKSTVPVTPSKSSTPLSRKELREQKYKEFLEMRRRVRAMLGYSADSEGENNNETAESSQREEAKGKEGLKEDANNESKVGSSGKDDGSQVEDTSKEDSPMPKKNPLLPDSSNLPKSEEDCSNAQDAISPVSPIMKLRGRANTKVLKKMRNPLLAVHKISSKVTGRRKSSIISLADVTSTEAVPSPPYQPEDVVSKSHLSDFLQDI